MHQFIEKQEAINNQTVQTLNDLKDTFAKFTFALAIQEKGKFPAQPQPNPRSFQDTQGISVQPLPRLMICHIHHHFLMH